MIEGKHIVIGLSGGIACYKVASLVRLFKKNGAEVQVVMTPHAKEFITQVTLSTLSGNEVISEFFTANTGRWHSHVDIGLWADAMIIAPATACTIGKMANGIADNMLITTYLSMKAPVWIAPAMDLDMMRHPSTEANLRTLASYGNHIIEPPVGELASHLIGKGRMEEPENIYQVITRHFEQIQELKDKKVIITSGPTYEKIDPVRFIGNYSSGKMGSALADVLASKGAQVIAVCGPSQVYPSHPGVKIIHVESALEMCNAAVAEFPHCNAAIMAAAVADYAPVTTESLKIKRENKADFAIQLKRNPDIAATLGQMKTPAQLLVGFALETDHELSNASAKIKKKNLDWIIMNSLKNPEAGFQKDTNHITIISAAGNSIEFPTKSKREVAADIIDTIFK